MSAHPTAEPRAKEGIRIGVGHRLAQDGRRGCPFESPGRRDSDTTNVRSACPFKQRSRALSSLQWMQAIRKEAICAVPAVPVRGGASPDGLIIIGSLVCSCALSGKRDARELSRGHWRCSEALALLDPGRGGSAVRSAVVAHLHRKRPQRPERSASRRRRKLPIDHSYRIHYCLRSRPDTEMIGNEFEVEEIDEAGQALGNHVVEFRKTEKRWMVTELGWLPLRWNSSHPGDGKFARKRLINSKSP